MEATKVFLFWFLPAFIHCEVLRISLSPSNSGGAEILSHTKQDLYYGQIFIGTPPQNFNVIFTTEIPVSWIPSSACSSKFCEPRNKYSSENSSSFTPNGKRSRLSFEGADVEGIVSTDNIIIAGLNVTGQSFIEASEVDVGRLNYVPTIDGMIGLGSPSFAENSLISSMKEQGLIKKKIFSVYLKSENETFGGEIIFGGSNPDRHTDNFTYIQTVLKGEWKLPIQSIDVEGKPISGSGANALVSITKKGIFGPREPILAIYAAVGAKYDTRYYVLKCSQIEKLPTINFKFGDKVFPLEPRDYTYQVYSKRPDVCATVFDWNLENSWTLGTPFINKYYTTFDLTNNRIGFAEAA